MASKINASKASEMSRLATKKVCAYYKQALEQTKNTSRNRLMLRTAKNVKSIFYTRLANIPGRYEAFGMEVDHAKHIIKNRQDLKIEDGGIASLLGLELLTWFYGGEIVGRGFRFIGYHV